jgi:uncharacterized protein YndB with AHSA1/START domain
MKEVGEMEGFELSIMINRPIEEVFGALTDLENDIKWRSEIIRPKLNTDKRLTCCA